MSMMINELKKAVAEELVIGVDDVMVNSVTKNNDTKMTGMAVKRKGNGNLSKIVYIDEAIERMFNGETTLSEEAKRIADELGKDDDIEAVLVDFNRQMILDQCFLVVVNAKMNEDLLKEVPYEKIEDLAVIVRVDVDVAAEISGSTIVKNMFLESYDISKDLLFKHASNNTLAKTGLTIRPMIDVMNDIMNEIDDGCADENVPTDLYVGSNKEKIYGAAIVAFPDMIAGFVKRLHEDVYVLPSSIHEVLLIPKSIAPGSVEDMKMMVTRINRNYVNPDEVLSNNVYEFCTADRQLRIAG